MNKAQLQKVLFNMELRGLNQLLVCSPMNIYYLTGRRIHPGERLAALVISRDGSVDFIANRLFAQSPLEGARLVEYSDTDDSAEVLSRCVKDGVLGVDKEFPCRFALPLMEKRPSLRLTLGSDCIDGARMLKTEAEIAVMRESSRLNDEALSRTIAELKPGMTENDVANLYRAAIKEVGGTGESFESLICFGAGCAEPHHETGDAVLKEGDSVILDVGLLYGSYCSDMTRTVFAGEPTEEQKKVYELVLRANEAGKSAVKPGVPLREVDAAARSVIEKAGYGEYFIHRTGHGIGLEVHEFPDASAVSEAVCTPGMVFSVEPGIYLPGHFGVRIEDLVAVTEDGCECLNHLPRELKSI